MDQPFVNASCKIGDRGNGGVASYDIPFSTWRTSRLTIPPKPPHLSGRRIVPKKITPCADVRTPGIPETPEPVKQTSNEISAILFGSPIDNLPSHDRSLSSAVRYPTGALFGDVALPISNGDQGGE
jgi:hypothetical protein